MSSKKVLEKKLARLEFVHDQLMTELDYVDKLMHLIGFGRGIATLKETAIDLYENGEPFDNDEG